MPPLSAQLLYSRSAYLGTSRCGHRPRGSLNIRIAKRLLQYMGRGPISLEQQRSQLRRLLNKQPPIEQYRRRALTDDHIREFICAELKRKICGSSAKQVLSKARL